MINKFPHLKDSTPFPTTDINVYKYRNEFDYTRYTGNVSIKLCVVPWCGDYENVVKFADDASRDAYIDALDGTELETMFNLLPQTSIKVPLPATNMQLYNYCVVDLPVMAPPDDPVAYASEPRIERYLYFIGDIRQSATNASECDLTLDVWATYINHVEFSNVMLERGHAPMAEVSVDEYLSAPMNHCRYLTTPDEVIEGASVNVTDTKVINFTGGEMWYAIATNADIESDLWGSISGATAATPAVAQMAAYTTQGLPTPRVYAIDVEDIEGFYVNVEEQCPQFMATVKATFFIEKQLAVRNDSAIYPTVNFCGYTMTRLTANQQIMNVLDISEAAFDFPEPYNKIAKLYTFPYSYIRISHEDGDSTIVRIENLADTLQMRVCAQITFPYLSIDTHLLNIGGVDENMTFNKESEGWSFRYGGFFAEYYKKHDIPCFYVVQESMIHATWAHLYDRIQARLAAENTLDSTTTIASAALNNSLAAAETTRTNQLASSSTARTNALNLVDLTLENLSLTIARNDDVVAYQNRIANYKTDDSQTAQEDLTTQDNIMVSAQLNASLNAVGVSQVNNAINTAANTASNTVSLVTDIATGAVSGAAGGAMAGSAIGSIVPGVGTATGAAAGAVIGAVGSTISAISSYASSTIQTVSTATQTSNTNIVTATNDSNLANTTTQVNDEKTSINNNLLNNTTTRNNNERSYINDADNDLNEDTTNNSTDVSTTNANNTYNTEVANANRTYNTETANANRTYNADINAANNVYNTAINAIENTFKQQSLEPPYEFGATANGEIAASRPIATWAQVITQNDGAIRYAGDAFLRYGYRLNQQWQITNLQVMPYYTYWKCSEIWCAGEQTVLEGAQNIIKAIMEQGVTVWSEPDKIGKVSIYDNI